MPRELEAFRPPERLTVSEWAEKHRVLDKRSSALPGPYRGDRTPYARAIMDAWTDPEIEHIILCTGTQLGKTTIAENCLGYSIHQDPGPVLIVYPTDDLAETISENRLEPMILACPVLVERYNKRASDKLELQFAGMFVALNGANSPSKLSSRPIRYLIRDEVDKFPRWSGQEADPLKLSDERTKNFYNKKVLDASTPTLRTGPIWQMMESADRLMRFEIPCPHCGYYQLLDFKRIKFPAEQPGFDARRRAEAAFYECEKCAGSIDDQQKLVALRMGRWRIERQVQGTVRSVAFHLSSLYSPWLTWSQIVYEWLSSQDAPEKLMNFINSWLAEPWDNTATRMRSDLVMGMKASHRRGQVHEDGLLIVAGVDVQLDHFRWVVRAFGPDITSWQVDYGRAETWAEIEEIIERDYISVHGEVMQINLAGIDSGYNTDEVYEFCAKHQGYVLPTKGNNKPMRVRYQISLIEKEGAGQGLKLYVIDTGQYKDSIFGRLQRKPGEPGAWMVCADVEREYADQICSEQKVPVTDRKGRTHEEWQPISSHAANHYLDAEVIAYCMAEVAGVRYLKKPEPPAKAEQAGPGSQAGFIPKREGWLR